MSYIFTSIWLWITSPLTAVLGTTGLIGAGLIVLGVIAPAWLPINHKNLIWAGACLIVGGFFYWWAFHAGEAHMAQRIAAQDAQAVSRVNDSRNRIRECGAANWDVTTGSCNRSTR